MICQFCSKICKNPGSLKNHENACVKNPKRNIEIYQNRPKNSHPAWNKGKTKETDERIKKQAEAQKLREENPFRGKRHTESSKKSISKSMMGNKNAHHRGDRQSRYNGIRMDSRWEVGVAGFLDKNSIQWKYGEKGFKLSDGRYYYPDFFIYEDNKFQKLIEVKGFFRPDNKLKFEMFKLEYPEIQVDLWDRKVLKSMDIIDASGYLKT